MDADVIVIGAGAAGLSAARSLANRSLRVMLLDARDRVGGRVWSRDLGRTMVPVELGAEFIHGQAPETKALLREAGTAAIDALGGDAWRDEKGDLRRDDNRKFGTAPGIFEGARPLEHDESVAQFLRRFAGDEAMRETVEDARAFVEGFEAADPAVASARAIGDEWRSGVDSTTARPLGGYAPMFARLRNACAAAGVQMCLSTAVRRILWRRGNVEIAAQDGSGALRAVRGKAVIVTLPVGVLRHSGDQTEVVFDPELPAAKRGALSNIEMGHAVKVTLWFRTAFWEAVRDGRYRDAGTFRGNKQPFGVYWTQLPIRSELIVAWVGGPKATAMSGCSEEVLVGRALHGFGSLFDELPRARREFEGGVVHDWGADPFARGAYSYVVVGGGDARATLGAPVEDTLFFAGEATSTDGHGGTVNGALETGERAACEAASSLRAEPAR